MKKIAIINQRYGKEVIGGSEYYTMLLANRLKKEYEVEILTSRSLTYDTWGNDYPNEEWIDDIHVRRFDVEGKRHLFLRKIIRNLIIRLHWKGKKLEEIWLRVLGPYLPGLIKFLKEHASEYDRFIFVTYLYYPTVMGLKLVMERSVFIPTAHDEPYINLGVYKDLFTRSHAIGYLTQEEKEMVEHKFHNEAILNEVIGTGIEVPDSISSEQFFSKYKIQGKYLLYVGRIEPMKGCREMFDAFIEMRQQREDLLLVVIGKDYMKIPESDGIRFLGTVSEKDKFAAMQGAAALWLPSANESLSLVVLEAMAVGTPVLVNGQCLVLEGHCRKSQAGIAYHNADEMKEGIENFFTQEHWEMRKNAKAYVQNNYTWEMVMKKLQRLLA